MEDMSIGKRILHFRKQNHLSQQELASKIDISRQTISKWEQDLSLPDIQMLMKLADIFGVSINQFIGVEVETTSFSELYEQINLAYRKLEKQYKSKNILQIILVLLCVVSLVLTLSMKHQLNQQLENSVNNPSNDIYLLENVLKEAYYLDSDTNYTYIEDFKMNYSNTDFKNWTIQMHCELSLKEYTEDTVVEITFFEETQGIENTYSLEKLSSNQYVLDRVIPLGNYQKVNVTIQTNGTYRTENIVQNSEFDLLTLEILNHIHLDLVKDQNNGTLDLKKLCFSSEIEEDSLQANIIFRFYLNNKNEYSDIFGFGLYKGNHDMDFEHSLPLEHAIRMSMEISIFKESGVIYNETIGVYKPSPNGESIYSYFIIDDVDESGNIF